jgi:hypothetical protein
MARVALYSTTADYRSLEFAQPDYRDGFACLATLTDNGEESSVSLDMIDPYALDMLGFFEELSAEDGWEGEKRWASEFNEISIIATNNREGSASLDVVMRSPDQEEQKRLLLQIPAEQLDQTAEQMRSFMRRPHGERFHPQATES